MATIDEMKEIAKEKLGVIGGVARDFGRGVSNIADIPKTIYQGTQTAGGANIPTVEETKVNLLRNAPFGPDVAGDLGAKVGKLWDSINIPSFGASNPTAKVTVLPSSSVAGPPVPTDSGASSGFSEFRTPTLSMATPPRAQLGVKGAPLSDWQAPTDIPGNKVLAENPNDAKFSDLMEQLMKVSSTGGPSVGRATQINAIKAAMQALAPMTSYGNFGVAGMGAETTRRGQDIAAGLGARGQDITARGQDISAAVASEGHGVTARGQDITANKDAMDSLYHSGVLELGKEKAGIERMKVDARNPENFMKMVALVSPKSKKINADTGAEEETHDLATGIKMLSDSGFPVPKGFKTPRPTITAEQAKAEMERRKAQNK